MPATLEALKQKERQTLESLPSPILETETSRPDNVAYFHADNDPANIPDAGFAGFAKLQKLDISNCQLAELPSLPPSLEHFVAIDNRFTAESLRTLPDTAKKLQVLSLSQCSGVTNLPQSFAALQEMRFFVFRENSLPRLPDAMGAWKKLSSLDMAGTKIANIDAGAVLGSLKNLEWVDFTGCGLASVPVALPGKSLQEAHFARNKISYLPDNVAQWGTTLFNLTGNAVRADSKVFAPNTAATEESADITWGQLAAGETGGLKIKFHSSIPSGISRYSDFSGNQIKHLPGVFSSPKDVRTNYHIVIADFS